jgi:hypothetical protein
MHTNTEYEHSGTFNGLDNVASMTDKIEAMVARIGTENTVFVLQLYDNSVFMVGGPGGESYHPVQDKKGIYHIDGRLVVANKDAVKVWRPDTPILPSKTVHNQPRSQNTIRVCQSSEWVSGCSATVVRRDVQAESGILWTCPLSWILCRAGT